jgi:copper transport protein
VIVVSARRRAALLLVGLLSVWLVTGVLTAGPAAAHAELVSTSPAKGARLDAPPQQVTLTFSEGVSVAAGYARVLDAGGDRVDSGAPKVDGDELTIGLRSDLPDGGYLVTYRVVSADSHPVSGGFSFVVGDGELLPVDSVSAAGGDTAVNALLPLTRWAGFAGLALAVGVPLFVAVCWPGGWAERRLRRLFGWGPLAVGVSALGGFLLQGPYAAGSGLGSLLDPALLQATLDTEVGWALLARGVLAGALAATLLPPWRHEEAPETAQLAGAAVFAFGLVGTTVAVGHAVAGPAPGLAFPVTFVHVAAMALWLGGLAALLAGLLRTIPAEEPAPIEEIAAALPRFSRLAFGCVVALVLSGVVQAVREVGALDALVSTGYGRALLVKLGFVVVILGAGAVSRVWVQQRLGARLGARRRVTAHAFAAAATEHEPAAGRRPPLAEAAEHLPALRRSIGLEFILAIAVLALSAILVGTPPARSTVSQPVDVTLPLQGSGGRDGSVQVTVDPARTGPNTLHLYLFDESGQLTQPAEIRVSIAQGDSIGPLDVDLAPAGPGHYIGDGLSFPTDGTWTLTVTVRLDEFTALTAATPVPVR